MISLSRRSFFIGTAAVLASVLMPRAIKLATATIGHKSEYRAYGCISVVGVGEQPSGFRTVTIYRPEYDDAVLFRNTVENRECCIWVAPPHGRIYVLENTLLGINVDGGGACAIALTFDDDDGNGFAEFHQFPIRGPASTTIIAHHTGTALS